MYTHFTLFENKKINSKKRKEMKNLFVPFLLFVCRTMFAAKPLHRIFKWLFDKSFLIHSNRSHCWHLLGACRYNRITREQQQKKFLSFTLCACKFAERRKKWQRVDAERLIVTNQLIVKRPHLLFLYLVRFLYCFCMISTFEWNNSLRRKIIGWKLKTKIKRTNLDGMKWK